MQHGRLRFKEPSDGNLKSVSRQAFPGRVFTVSHQNGKSTPCSSDVGLLFPCRTVDEKTNESSAPRSADPLQKEFVVATVTSGTGIKWAQCTDIYVTFFSLSKPMRADCVVVVDVIIASMLLLSLVS